MQIFLVFQVSTIRAQAKPSGLRTARVNPGLGFLRCSGHSLSFLLITTALEGARQCFARWSAASGIGPEVFESGTRQV